MGCTCCKDSSQEEETDDKDKEATEYTALNEKKKHSYVTVPSRVSSADGSAVSAPRISRSSTRLNTYLLKIGFIGEMAIVERRCWMLRLLDGHNFDAGESTQSQSLQNNQISQCNKNVQIDKQTYCAHIQIWNDMQGLADNDANDLNAMLLCYDITSTASFEAMKQLLSTIYSNMQSVYLQSVVQIAVMGLVPSCDVSGDITSLRAVDHFDVKQLCTQYADKLNIEFVGESNAKTGDNVIDVVKNLIQRCITSQFTEL